MTGIEARSFQEPKASSLAIGREVLEPGWRWSVHVKPIVGTERCEFHHVLFLVEGRMGVETRDGETREVAAGSVVDVAPGHDAWVVGDDHVVSLDFQGVVGWARPPDLGDGLLTTLLARAPRSDPGQRGHVPPAA